MVLDNVFQDGVDLASEVNYLPINLSPPLIQQLFSEDKVQGITDSKICQIG